MNKTKYLQHYLNLYKRNDLLDNLPTLEILKEEYIRYLLELTDFDIHQTAEILDISPEILKRKLTRFDFKNQNTKTHQLGSDLPNFHNCPY